MAVTFNWTADLECVDEGGLENVIKAVHWRCTASDGVNDLAAAGVVSMGDPDAENFIPAPDGITSELIRSWVGPEAEANENTLAEQLSSAAAGGEVKRFSAPPPDLAAPSTG